MSFEAFSNLQNAVVKGVDFSESELTRALMFSPDSPESYSTFTRALMKGRVDSTNLFVTAALMSINVNNIYVRYAGLALRYGANANAYVKASFNFGDEIVSVPIHLAKKLWDATPRTREESLELDFQAFGDVNEALTDEQVEARLQEKQRASLDLLCMMAIQGLVFDAKITTADLLVTSGINATSFINAHPEFFSSVYGDMRNSGLLGATFADEISYFIEWKKSMQNAYGVNPDRDPRIFKYSLFLDYIEVLTWPEIYTDMNNLRLMFFFQDVESIKLIVPRMIESNKIGVRREDYSIDENGYEYANDYVAYQRESELIILDWCISYYNLTAFRILMMAGIIPDYSFRSQTIRASRAICSKYPVQCQILNTILIDMVKTGHGLDTQQMQELGFSPSTLAAVKKEYSVPSWKYMCKIRSGDINPDMKEMARQAGIPVGLSKNQMCSTFESVTQGDPSSVKAATYAVNRNRIALSSISTADIVSGKRSLNGDNVLPNGYPAEYEQQGPLCTNEDSLFRPIEDYPDVDRVTYSDGSYTWCFTSDNFEELIQTRMNRWALDERGQPGVPIPDSVIIEMQQKLDSIRREGLMMEPGSISKGIDELYDASPAKAEAIYENETFRRLEEFYQFSDQYGIDRSVYASLTSEDYQTLADGVLGQNTRVVVDRSTPTMALRDFAAATMLETKNFQNRQQVGQLLASILVR